MSFTILDRNEEAYTVRKGNIEDLDKVLELFVITAEWLATKGTTQWDYYIHDLEGNTKEVLDSIKTGSTFLVEYDNELVASVTLEANPNEWDQDIWGEEAEQNDVMYLHRFVVHREFSGLHLGTNLLKWSELYAIEKGKSRIRFDCLASNEGLNNYYQRRYELKGLANIYGQHCKYEVIL